MTDARDRTLPQMIEAMKKLPRRLEYLGGQQTSYVQLDNVLALLEEAAFVLGLPKTAENTASNLRTDLARLLDNLYGLHLRPGHLDAVMDVIHLHAPEKVVASPPVPGSLLAYVQHKKDCEIHEGKEIVYPEPVSMPSISDAVKMAQGRLATGRPDENLIRTSRRPTKCTCGLAELLGAGEDRR